METLKTCPKCKTAKPRTDFGKSNKTKDGLRSWCKVCHNASNKKWSESRPDYFKEHYLKNSEKKKAQVKQYAKDNVEKIKAAKKLYRINNADKVSETYKKWLINNPGKKSEQDRKYRNANKTRLKENYKKWLQKNPEKLYEYSQRWRLKNRGLVNAATRRYQSRKKQAMPPWVDINSMKQIYVDAQESKMTVDHICPLSHPRVCGLHVPWNLQLLSAHDNYVKNNKLCPALVIFA